jgi:hypothetical protein
LLQKATQLHLKSVLDPRKAFFAIRIRVWFSSVTPPHVQSWRLAPQRNI